MSTYKFEENDIIFNIMRTHPNCEFLIYNGKVYFNNNQNVSGSFASHVTNVRNGFVSLYELNIDRTADDTGLIYPFITKDGSRDTFSTISTTDFNTQFNYGDVLSGSYPLSASITREYFSTSDRKHVDALRNTLDYHARLSPKYQFSSSHGNKETETVNLISIPSIFYGSSIEKGTVSLDYYLTGTLIGQLRDKNKNGELIQVGPTGSVGSGSVAGVVLYDEGFVLLTGSWSLNNNQIDYISDPSDLQASKWIYYGVGANDTSTPNASIQSASYVMAFNGTEKIPTITMLARAPKGELNFSNNPTFIDYSSNKPTTIATSSISYAQLDQNIKNTISSSFPDPTGSFERQVFITKIAIYDDDDNLLGIASMAKPIKKAEEDSYTFKLKLDL